MKKRKAPIGLITALILICCAVAYMNLPGRDAASEAQKAEQQQQAQSARPSTPTIDPSKTTQTSKDDLVGKKSGPRVFDDDKGFRGKGPTDPNAPSILTEKSAPNASSPAYNPNATTGQWFKQDSATKTK